IALISKTVEAESRSRVKKALKFSSEEEFEIGTLMLDLARVTSRLLGNKDVLVSLQKQETATENARYHALHELERLQVARHGGHVIPPYALEVGIHQSGAENA